MSDITDIGGHWRRLCPEGRTIFYEGDDPAGFALEIHMEFGFNPSQTPARDWDGHEYRGWDPEHGYAFHCPPEHLDDIYGSDRWPMGS